jgi:ADP-ribose pyrophosphatase YjhB (NUDIX family)
MAVQLYRASVEITVFRGDKILAVTNRKFGGFSCPGGKLEPGEELEDGASRELLEETGCKALTIRPIAGMMHKPLKHDPEHTRWFCTGFIADIGGQEPTNAEEGTKVFWTTREDLLTKSLFPEWYSWWFGLLGKLGELPK